MFPPAVAGLLGPQGLIFVGRKLYVSNQNIYEVDPLLCSRCGAVMKVIAVSEEEVIYRILSHLKLLSPGDGPRAPPRSGQAGFASPATPVSKELSYEPVYDLPAASAQAGDLPWPDPA